MFQQEVLGPTVLKAKMAKGISIKIVYVQPIRFSFGGAVNQVLGDHPGEAAHWTEGSG